MEWFRYHAMGAVKSMAILIVTTCIALFFMACGFTEANIITIYILSVLIISVITTEKGYSLIASAVSVIVFNFFFTEPKFTLQVNDPGYIVTFIIMFVASLLTGGLASELKDSARQSSMAAYRTRILFETNQQFARVHTLREIEQVLASQLLRLLNKDVVYYPVLDGRLEAASLYLTDNKKDAVLREAYLSDDERKLALRVLLNKQSVKEADSMSEAAKCLYYTIRMNDRIYGVIGIAKGEHPLELFENSIFLSILGEAAMAMENVRISKEKEEAALLAQNEKLRANLLRSISHDLRTPLTSISGNAGILLTNDTSLNGEQKIGLVQNIYDDALWLNNLVENLLSITRIENGTMNLRLQPELLEDVITEALQHVNRNASEHEISVSFEDPLLLVRADARLLVQVFINLIDNAIKYTPAGSYIQILSRQEGQYAVIEIKDNGPGIDKQAKAHIFEMFYTANADIVDSRRSMGLGLFLCKSIVNAHGGDMIVKDNEPSGSIFMFTIPVEEVVLHE